MIGCLSSIIMGNMMKLAIFFFHSKNSELWEWKIWCDKKRIELLLPDWTIAKLLPIQSHLLESSPNIFNIGEDFCSSLALHERYDFGELCSTSTFRPTEQSNLPIQSHLVESFPAALNETFKKLWKKTSKQNGHTHCLANPITLGWKLQPTAFL